MEHLEGITVLNELIQGVHGFVIFLAIVSAIGVMATILYSIECIKEKKYKKLPDIIMILIFLILFCFTTWNVALSYERQLYEVLVSEEVSATEFIETYKIEEIRGDIYVVEFRDE